MQNAKKRSSHGGFTLIELMIAIFVIMIGVMGLAGLLTNSVAYMLGSQDDFIARQKAAEAMEAIFTAKYDNTITFSNIANTTSTPPGIFLAGAQPLLQPGPDGLVGTVADETSTPDYLISPGPDGLMGTADDVKVPLDNFTRTITITPSGDTNLTQITITINYTAASFQRSYTMQSYISAFN